MPFLVGVVLVSLGYSAGGGPRERRERLGAGSPVKASVIRVRLGGMSMEVLDRWESSSCRVGSCLFVWTSGSRDWIMVLAWACMALYVLMPIFFLYCMVAIATSRTGSGSFFCLW